VREGGGAEIIKRGKKPLTHQRQQGKGSARGGGEQHEKETGNCVRVKTNPNFFFLSLFSKCRIQKRIIERDSGGLWKYGGIRLLTEEIDGAEILRMCCLGIC